jgi:hypothetical protein
MPAFLDELGFVELLAALFVIVLVRAQATYWVARAVVTGAASRRWGRWLESPALKRASALLARYGAPAVTVSFLTVGLQTMINAAAGAARMRFGVYRLGADLCDRRLRRALGGDRRRRRLAARRRDPRRARGRGRDGGPAAPPTGHCPLRAPAHQHGHGTGQNTSLGYIVALGQ